MAKIYSFPGQATRALIHTNIELYAAKVWSRQQMMSQVFDIMKRYGVSQLNIRDYSVRIAEPQITDLGVFPVVIIEARKVVDEPRCPVCDSTVYGYLDGGDGIVSAMCMDCGCIYQFREVLHENSGDVG